MMTRKTIWRGAVAVLISVLVAAAASAAPNDFYTGLLKRGIAHVQSGTYDAAMKELRVAAFGLVDDVDQFEIAQVYLTIAAQKLNKEPDARHAAQRVLAAERIEPHYANLPLPADVRAQFEKIVTTILTSDQIAVLHARPPAPISPQPVAPIVPAPQPRPVPPPPAPQPQPQPRSPAPITPQPVAPIVVPPTPQPQTGKPIIAHPAPRVPIELPPAAPRGEVEPPSVPTGPKITKPAPAPVPVPVPRAPQPAPPPPATATADPVAADRALEERLRTIEQRETRPALSAAELSRRLSAADAALAKDDLSGARTIYRALVQTAGIDHNTAIRIAEGSYRARDFATTALAFERAGGLRRGEEPYHYYLAVALFETGKYRAAKRELDAALPYIEVTPDVAGYRTKINGALQ